MKSLNRFAACFFCFLTICLSSAAASAQTSKPASSADDGAVLRALLAEVHGLRMALERSNINAQRSQILVERLRIQQGQVDRVTHLVDGVRNELSELQFMEARLVERAKEIERTAEQFNDSEERLKQCREELANLKERASYVRQREIQISNQLREERGKLDELNDRLDQLVREVEDSRPLEKPRR
jgi:chromosome segregation ATPase